MANEQRTELAYDQTTETVAIVGPITKSSAIAVADQFERLTHRRIRSIDLSRVTSFDRVGTALVRREIERRQLEPQHVLNAGRELSTELQREAEPESTIKRRGAPGSGLPGIGVRLNNVFAILGQYALVTADLFGWSAVALVQPRRYHRKGSVSEQCFRIGSQAVPVLSVLSLVLGLILALQSAAQLRQVGASVFIADLLAIAVIREMAPMMTAILLAGRSGSSITSEIGTMRVTEELDALRVMGISPLRYVMVPMFLGGSIVMPFLVAIAIIMSALGGLFTAVIMLDLSPIGFLDRLVSAISAYEVFMTFLKSEVFMWGIISIGCHYGLRVRGGSQEIGKATTSSVVASIFTVILVDVLFSLTAL